MYYEDVFRELDYQKVDYVVVGGIALVLHGVVRLTADLDLALRIDADNLDKFLAAMRALSYKPKLPIDPQELLSKNKRDAWRKYKNMQAFSFVHPNGYQLIDVLLDTPVDYAKLAKRKQVVTAKGINIPIVCRDDLIKLKTAGGRPQDLADITALEQLAKMDENNEK